MTASLRRRSSAIRSLFVGMICLGSYTLVVAQQPPQSQGGLFPRGQEKQKQSIEDMFENVARARAERTKGEQPLAPDNGQLGDDLVPSPGTLGGGNFPSRTPFLPGRIPQNTLRDSLSAGDPFAARPQAIRQSIVLRSAAFQDDFRSLDRRCASLAQLLRDDALRNPVIGQVLPSANRLSSETRMMLQNASVNTQVSDALESYRRIDRGWRQLAFQLRGLVGVSGEAIEAAHQCDQLISRMSRQLGLGPQFDRGKLRDELLVIGSSIHSLGEDLRLADISLGARQSLSRGLRLLRQDALNFVDRVEYFEQADLVRGLNALNARWEQIALAIGEIADVHVQYRVQGVTESFRKAHGILWIKLPPHDAVLPAAASRLVMHARNLLSRLEEKLVNADQLTGAERIRLSARNLLAKSEVLSEQVSRNDSLVTLQSNLAEIQQGWLEFRTQLLNDQLVGLQMILSIDGELQRLRTALGVANDAVKPMDRRRLLQTAAAIESTAEFVSADLNRFSRLLTPLTYRETTLAAASAFMQSAKLFHQTIDHQADAVTIRRAADAMQKNWNLLLPNLAQIQLHGLTAYQARNLLQDQSELVEYISEVSTLPLP